MGQTYSTQAFSDIDSYLTSKKMVENQKLVRKTQSVTPLQNRTEIQKMQESWSTAVSNQTYNNKEKSEIMKQVKNLSPLRDQTEINIMKSWESWTIQQAKFPCKNPVFPTQKGEGSKQLSENEKTKNCLLVEKTIKLQQDNESLKFQMQQRIYQEEANLYHEQAKTYKEQERRLKEVKKNEILQEKLSRVEEELFMSHTICMNDCDYDPMNCSSDSDCTLTNDVNLMDCSSDSEATLVNCSETEQKDHPKADDHAQVTSSSPQTGQFDFEQSITEDNDSGIYFESDIEVKIT
ncbi:uncharacterized protein LOC134817383 [Bolinopsis microptera]|uniref:uncharacterized protein LOC134817383 n=1 Tax=Bolinopsis microptera TaxID=2820187 RepID=UPI003079EA4B